VQLCEDDMGAKHASLTMPGGERQFRLIKPADRTGGNRGVNVKGVKLSRELEWSGYYRCV